MTTTHAQSRARRWRSSLEACCRVLVHSNLFISLATMSVVITTVILADLPLEPIPLFIVFAATLFVYTLNRFTDLEEDEENVPDRAAFTKRYGRLLLALGICWYLGAIGAAVVLGVPGAPYLLLPLVAAVLYSVGGVKRVLLVKNGFVGVAWGLLPLGAGYYYDSLWTPEILFLAGYITAMITIAAIVFDIKDIDGDRAEGIATVPNTAGVLWTRRLTQGGNLVVATAVVTVVALTSLSSALLVVLVMNVYVVCYIPFATAERGPLFYGFVIDGEHVFLAAVVIALELVW